jgi:predicted signal transduction protein with EAL and GGDEF domain
MPRCRSEVPICRSGIRPAGGGEQARQLSRERFREEAARGDVGCVDAAWAAAACLRQAIRRATDEGRPLVLALLDIDGLGQLNRRLGHLAGDAVLRSLADLLRQRFRRTDVLGRYNGRSWSCCPTPPSPTR